MKKLLAGLAVLVCMSCAPRMFAQGTVKITPLSPVTWSDTGLIQGSQRCQSLKGTNAYAHTFVYTTQATTSTILVTITASTDGTVPGATITTKTTTSGDIIQFSGVYSNICFTVTTLTGTGAKVAFSYGGDISAGASITAAASAFATGAIVDLGTTIDNKCTTSDTTACTLIAIAKGLYAQLVALNALAVTDPCDGTIPSIKRYISVGSTEDESQVKATAGTLCRVQASNANATTNAWMKCTNLTAANTTPGSSVVFWDMLVPFGLGNQDSPHIPFSVALTCYIVTGNADSDATEVGANDVHYVLEYQ